jgi:hypothetical protein
MKTWARVAAALLFSPLAQAADEPALDFPSVAAALDALRADPAAQFESQAGWLLVATSEHGNPVLWSFTPVGHPAHPAVVKRTALEEKGTGYVELTTLCQGPEPECFRLLDDFRQKQQRLAQRAVAKRLVLDVGIAQNDHDRVLVRHLLAEEGKAAEIRMDELLKVVIVPSWDEVRGVMLWTAMYEFDGSDFRLAAQPTIVAAPGHGAALIEVPGAAGDTFRFSITPVATLGEAAASETGL